MTWIASNSNNNAFQAWQKDKQERSVIASSPSKAVQSGVSFKRASRAMNTNYASGLLNSRSAGKGGKSYQWETDNLYKLPRSYGRSYDEKFNNYAKKVLGIDSAEADRFRKFLDAKEKGQLTTDMMSNTTKAMNDAFARAKLSKSEKQDEAPIVPHKRGRLETVLDALMVGNRASANAIDYKLNGKSFWQGALDGAKTALPWEVENTDKNRITFADVLKKDYVDKNPGNMSKLRDIVGSGFFGATGYGASKLIGAMGGKGETVANKLALSGGGLALDIAGDPTTYMSGGLSALVKGTGKGVLRQAGKAMTEDVARNIVEKHASTTGKVLTETELSSEAKKLFDKYHSVLGTNRTAENIRVGLGKASVPIPGSAKVLQHVGDYTVAPAYNTARKMIYGSQIGKLFSTKSGLYNFAKTDPSKLYDVMDFMVKTQGREADKIAGEQGIRNYVKQNLANLSEHDTSKIIELMQDKTVFTKVKRMVDIKGMSEARVLKRQMAKDAETMKNTLDTADAHRTTIEQMQTENFGQLDKAKQVMDNAEKEYVDNVASLKFDKNMNEQDMARAIDHVRNASKTMDAKYEGLSVPLRPNQETPNLVDVGEKPKRPYTKNPAEPQLDTVQPPVYPKEPNIGNFADPNVKELQFNASGTIDEWNKLKDKHTNHETGQQFIDQAMTTEFAGKFSQLIFGESDKISPAIYPNALDQIERMIREGWDKHHIIDYVHSHAHQYDGRAVDIDRFVADKFNYGSGLKYKNWKEFYTDRVEEIYKRAEKNGGEVVESDKKLLNDLEQTKLERSMLRAKMMDMSKSELLDFRKTEANKSMEEVLRGANNQELMDEIRRQKFTDEDRAQVDEFRGVDRKTHEFDDKESLSAERKAELEDQLKRSGDYFSDSDMTDVRGRLINEFREQGIAGKGNLASKQVEWMNKVVNNIPEILLRNFAGRKWTDLSLNAQKFIVGMAKRHVLAKADGTEVKFESVIKNKVKERAETLSNWEHAEAVRASTNVGSEVVIKNEKGIRITGRVTKTHLDNDGLVTYTVKRKTGEEVTVKAESIVKVGKKKPIDYVLDNTMEQHINKQFEEAMTKHKEEIARLDEEYNKQVAEVEARNAEKGDAYKAELEKAKEERASKKAEYDKQLEEYNAKSDANLSEELRVHSVNHANMKDWNEAIRKSSEVADDYLKQRDAFGEDLKDIEWDGLSKEIDFYNWKSQLTKDFDAFAKDQDKNIRDLELNGDKLQKQLDDMESATYDGKTLREIEAHYNSIKEASDSWDAYGTWLETNFKTQLDSWDKKYGNKDLGKEVIETSDASPLVKKLVGELRTQFKDVAQKELEIGALKQGQVDKWLEGYLSHVPTPEGEAFLKKYRLEEVDGVLRPVERTTKDGKPDITDAMGYGEEYSAYSLSRQIKNLHMPDGTWVKDPTIEQINLVMRPFLNGKNAFSENIADIYLARMLKHNNLMYDNKYLTEMMRTFGKNHPDASFTAEKGFKTVMNYGGFKQNVHDMARIQGSLQMSSDIRKYILEQKQANLEPDVEQFVKDYIASGKPKENYDTFLDHGFSHLGMNKENFKELSTPLLHVSSEQAQAINKYYESTLQGLKDKYQKFFDELDTARQYGDEVSPETLAKLEEHDATLKSLAPLEIKQMNDVIVHKANMARELQFAKNRNGLVKIYDKFTHLLKLNQTAIMPSFHVRNAKSNLFQVWLAVGSDIGDVGMHRQVYDIIKNNGDMSALKDMSPLAIKDKDGNVIGSMNWDEVYNLAKSHGVVNEGFFAKDLHALDESKGVFKGKLQIKGQSLDPTDTKGFVGYKIGTHVGNKVENQARLFQFASHIKNGMNPADAKEMVDKFLFDYSDLTSFEHNVMRRIFPYYTWIRKNGKLQLSQMIDQPGKYRDAFKAMNAVDSGIDPQDQVESQYLAPFAKDWKQTMLNFTSTDANGKTSTEPVLWNPNLPFMDLQRLPNPMDLGGSIKTAIPQMNSMIKSPIELGFNKNFFFDSKVVEDKDTAGQGLLKRADYLANQFSPFTAMEGFVQKKGVYKFLHGLNTFTGEKFLSYNYEKSKDMTIQKYMGGDNPDDKPLWIDQSLDKISLETQTRRVQGDLTEMTRKFINGEDLTAKNTGAYYPFVKVMQSVGLDNASTRQWVGGAVEGTNLEKYLLNNDIANAKVTRVLDGDTVDVIVNGKKERLRFNLIDTPEISHAQGELPMAFGDDARHWTESMVNGRNIQVVISRNADMHGRLVSYLYVDGEDVNKSLIQQGLAHVRYANISTNPYNKADYMDAQQNAYKKKKGLWQIPGYADPKTDSVYTNKNQAYKRYLELKGK
jgi:endonuclease YncB( thermonuclease family)